MQIPFLTRTFVKRQPVTRSARSIVIVIGAIVFVLGIGHATFVGLSPLQTSTQPIGEAPKWDVVLVKPCAASDPQRGGIGTYSRGSVTLPCNTPRFLIQMAYDLYADGLKPNVVITPRTRLIPVMQGPSWMDSERYAINAKTEADPQRGMMLGPMLQSILEDRFKLKMHRETRDMAVYVLTVARGGIKAVSVKEGSCIPINSREYEGRAPDADVCAGFTDKVNGTTLTLDLHARTMSEFAQNLGLNFLDLPVIDRTGVGGMFDFHLEFALEDTLTAPLIGAVPKSSDEPSAVSIFTAVQEQLGLKLERTRGPSAILVIDSISRPSPN